MKLKAAPLLLLLLCGFASAEELTNKLAAELFAVAYGQYKGSPSLLDRPPKISIIPQTEVCMLMSDPPDCLDRGGVYDPASSIIFISENLDFAGIDARALLIHEFVHHFQERERGPAKTCEEYLRRETQAYGIQADVLEKAGLPYTAQKARNFTKEEKCPAE